MRLDPDNHDNDHADTDDHVHGALSGVHHHDNRYGITVYPYVCGHFDAGPGHACSAWDDDLVGHCTTCTCWD